MGACERITRLQVCFSIICSLALAACGSGGPTTGGQETDEVGEIALGSSVGLDNSGQITAETGSTGGLISPPPRLGAASGAAGSVGVPTVQSAGVLANAGRLSPTVTAGSMVVESSPRPKAPDDTAEHSEQTAQKIAFAVVGEETNAEDLGETATINGGLETSAAPQSVELIPAEEEAEQVERTEREISVTDENLPLIAFITEPAPSIESALESVVAPVIELDLELELLSPTTGDTVNADEPVLLKWIVPAAMLATINAFDIQIVESAQSTLIYRNSVDALQACNTEGACSYSVTSLFEQSPGGDFEWQLGPKSGDVTNGYFYESFVLQSRRGQIAEGSLNASESRRSEPQNAASYLNYYYVDNAGVDSNDGNSPDQAVRTLQKAVDMAGPGDVVYIKAGNYADQTLLITRSGTPELPITISGYKLEPGDNPKYEDFDHTSDMYSSMMPLLDTGSRTGDQTAINITGDHIIVRNLQIRNYQIGIYVRESEGLHIDNVILANLGDPNYREDNSHYNGAGFKFTLTTSRSILSNSVVVNSTGESISISGSDHLMEGNRVYSDDNSTGKGSATDYYFVLSNAFDCVVRNNRLERVGDLGHGGHGFTVKYDNQGNLFEDNLAINLEGGGFVARRDQAAFNTFRNNRVVGGTGILVNTGAYNNTFTGFTINNAIYGIWFFGSSSERINPNGFAAVDNLFTDIEINGATRAAIAFVKSDNSSAISEGNIFENLTITDAPVLFKVDHDVINNVLKDSTVSNVAEYMSGVTGHLRALPIRT